MKNLDQWLQEYSWSHQNPTNRVIHKICVPLILLSLFGILWDFRWHQMPMGALILAGAGLIFYARWGLRVFVVMLLQLLVCFGILFLAGQEYGELLYISLGIFAFAWIGQFIGHKFEGAKPSFFQDLQFLLIGPLWVFQRALVNKS